MDLQEPYSNVIELRQIEFNWIKDYLYKQTGIVLNPTKKAMVMGRLEKRLRHLGLNCYTDYIQLLQTPDYQTEATTAVDLLTTNETSFFREPEHFEFLEGNILSKLTPNSAIRIWSAGCSTGEEVYTLAMILAEHGKNLDWEIIGSDISTQVLKKAMTGLYPESAIQKIPDTLLKKYCLKGCNQYQNLVLINPLLRRRIKFVHINLNSTLPKLGVFDVIFLRNVMIYFNQETKQKLVQRICEFLKPGGHFFVGHSESMANIQTNLKCVAPAIFIKPLS